MFEYLQKLSQSVLSALGLQFKSQFIMQRYNLNLYLLMKKKKSIRKWEQWSCYLSLDLPTFLWMHRLISVNYFYLFGKYFQA